MKYKKSSKSLQDDHIQHLKEMEEIEKDRQELKIQTEILRKLCIETQKCHIELATVR